MGELLRSTAPVYWKGLAAGIVLASVLSLGGPAAKGVRSLGQGQAWIRQGIAERAAQEFADNFHYGMTSWNGGKDWLYNAQGGYIRPSSLALFGPSMQLSDYRMEFLAQIERRSVGWVVRAKDERNYYAMKFTVTEPGPRPMVAVERYPVINGKHGPRVQVPVPLIMQNDVPYRVQLDVRGNEFRASIEGQVVDSWTDDQLTTGGVGFFSDAGERARVYWMRVAHNDDLLGRVCAVLAKA